MSFYYGKTALSRIRLTKKRLWYTTDSLVALGAFIDNEHRQKIFALCSYATEVNPSIWERLDSSRVLEQAD